MHTWEKATHVHKINMIECEFIQRTFKQHLNREAGRNKKTSTLKPPDTEQSMAQKVRVKGKVGIKSRNKSNGAIFKNEKELVLTIYGKRLFIHILWEFYKSLFK